MRSTRALIPPGDRPGREAQSSPRGPAGPREGPPLDNLTHTLLGAALARTRLGRSSQLATGLLLLGVNLPDLDVLAGLGGRASYLEHHRGVTHGVLGACLQVAILVAIGRALELRRARKSARPPQQGTGRLWLLCAIAVGSHPLLDLLNVYGLRPWLPFDGRWYYGDLLFIVDPWLWLLLATAAWLGGERAWKLELLVALLLMSGAAMLLIAPQTPSHVRVLWPCLALLLGLAGYLRPALLRARSVLPVCMALAVLYIGAMALLGRAALRRGLPSVESALAENERILQVAHAPTAGNPLAWQVLVLTETASYVLDLHLPAATSALKRYDRRLNDPAVRATLASPCGLSWTRFARFPFARTSDSADIRKVQLSDVRFLVGARSQAPDDPLEPEWFTQEAKVRGGGVECLRESGLDLRPKSLR